MTAAELRAWAARMGYSRDEAARALALAPTSYRGIIYGRRKVGAQTARIAELLESGTAAQRSTGC
jgi:plasmid maintenance system antidote protein VapI